MRVKSLGLLIPAAAVALGILSGPAALPGQSSSALHSPRERPPYTAEIQIKSVQTLANGTTITRESKEIIAVDSQSRRMTSTTEETGFPGLEPGTRVHVEDPVGGTRADWDSRTKRATVLKLPPQDQPHGCWADDAGRTRMSWFDGTHPAPAQPSISTGVRPEPKVEDLGTSSIQGVEAHGRRTTITTPAGAMGNDQPLITTNETWMAPDLGLIVRSVREDPRQGTTTRELVNLSQSEPDPSLFQPPEGYEVKTSELHQVECQQ